MATDRVWVLFLIPKRDCPQTYSWPKSENPGEGVSPKPGSGARPQWRWSGVGSPVTPIGGGAISGKGAGQVVPGAPSVHPQGLDLNRIPRQPAPCP